MWLARTVLMIGLLLIGASTIASADGPYSITEQLVELGSDPVERINDKGQIVGRNKLYTPNGLDPNNFVSELISGGAGAVAFDINEDGKVVGHLGSASYLWTPSTKNGTSGSHVPLNGHAFGINESGTVAGWLQIPGDLRAYSCSYPYSNNDYIMYDPLPGGFGSQAFSINDSGKVAGCSYTGEESYTHAACFNCDPKDLGDVGGHQNAVQKINNSGISVGGGLVDSASLETVAFRTTGNGQLTPLGALANHTDSYAYDVNDGGVTVGSSAPFYGSPLEDIRAFVHSPGTGMQDLNDLIDSGSGWTLNSANGINNCGQIVGGGHLGSAYRSFLYSPPGTAMIFDPDPITTSGVTALPRSNGLDTTAINRERRCVSLPRLVNSGDENGFLTGTYVSTSLTSNRVYSADKVFIFPRSLPGFEEVMAYYHVDAAIDYAKSLGFTISTTPPFGIEANYDGSSPAGSFYRPSDRSLHFKVRDSQNENSVDHAEDAGVIWHESGHAIAHAVSPDFAPSSSLSVYDEDTAVNEGFADYFALSRFYKESGPLTGEDEATYPSKWYRTAFVYELGRQLRWSAETKVSTGDQLNHKNGLHWSAALWAIRKKLIELTNESTGHAWADKLAIGMLMRLDGEEENFHTASEKLLKENEIAFSEANQRVRPPDPMLTFS